MQVRHRGLLWLLGGCMAAIGLAFALGAERSWRLIEANGTRAVTREVRLVKEHAEKLLSAQVGALYQIDGQVARSGMGEVESRGFHEELKRLITPTDEIASLWIVGLDGFTKATSFTFPPPRIDLNDRDYVREHVDQGAEWFVSPIVRGRHDQKLLFGVSKLLRSGGGVPIGIATATAYPEYFQGFYAALGLEAGDVVGLARADGPVLAWHPPRPDDPTTLRLPPPLLGGPGERPEGTFRAPGFDGTERIWGFSRLDRLPIVAFFGRSVPALTELWWRQLLHYALYGLPAVAALLLFGLAAAASTRQLELANLTLEQRVSERAEALRRSEERFRVAQELSLDGFTILKAVRDDQGTIRDFEWEYANPAAQRLLKESGGLVGQRLLERLPGNREASDLFERYVKVVETGQPHDYELFYASEGIRGWFRNMAVKLGDGVMVSFADITARKQLELEREQALERKETLLREMNHRIKNSLQLVASVLGLQRHGVEDETARAELAEAAARVGAIALIHERLYRTDQVEMVEIGSYLEQLGQDLERSLAEPGKGRAIHVAAETVLVPTDRVAPLALIANELITNAFKYAYPTDVAQADVALGLRVTPAGAVELTVEDGGVGLSPDFDPATSPGLGLRLVTSLVRQIGGTLTLDRAGSGARFVITMPLDVPWRHQQPPTHRMGDVA